MMVLVDTSVWVDFLRKDDERLSLLLSQNRVCMHPMIIGELACGHLKNRTQLLALWQNLAGCSEASHEEAMILLDSQNLMGQGIGFIDLHLLAATLLSSHTRLWTRDKRLCDIAESLNIAFKEH
jgi:hypothetical protein